MRINDEARYPDTTVEAVLAMLTDSTFQEALCAALRAGEFDVKVTPGEGGAAQVLVQRSLPTDTVPEFLRSFVGSTVNVIERTTWSAADTTGRRPGTVNVSIAGTPVLMTAQTMLTAEGNDVVQTVQGEIKASVPLLGTRIEKAVEPAIRGALRLQERQGRTWLNQP